MIELIAAAAIAIAVWGFLNWLGGIDRRLLSATARLGGGILLLSMAVLLILRGKVYIAVVPVLAALAVSRGWFSGRGPAIGRNQASGRDQPPGHPERPMTQAEALDILGLKSGATRADIKAAHRRLIAKMHPDQGGSGYLAARINAARDFLLKNQIFS